MESGPMRKIELAGRVAQIKNIPPVSKKMPPPKKGAALQKK